jgi:SAM-dependent methyltransferase
MAIRTITRHTLEPLLREQLTSLPAGRVVEIGVSKNYSPYKKWIPNTEYITVDQRASFNPHLCADACNLGIKSDSVDTVVILEVLEHTLFPYNVVQEIHRILKPGGKCILSTRFIFPYHPSPNDYYRFTRDALETFFKVFSSVSVFEHGNRFQAVWQVMLDRELFGRKPLHIKIMRRFNKLIAQIMSTNKLVPLGYLVIAKK